jgi:hypothetical protein
MDFYLIWILIFFGYLLLDMLYAIYTFDIINRKPIRAGTMASLIYSLSAFGVINYVHNYWYIIPMALGAWFGTYIVVKWKK